MRPEEVAKLDPYKVRREGLAQDAQDLLEGTPEPPPIPVSNTDEAGSFPDADASNPFFDPADKDYELPKEMSSKEINSLNIPIHNSSENSKEEFIKEFRNKSR